MLITYLKFQTTTQELPNMQKPYNFVNEALTLQKICMIKCILPT